MTTQTFSYTGADQSWVVPAGVTQVDVECWGGQGGAGAANGGAGGTGGLGGYVKATAVPVTAGETLTIIVGGQGTAYGGGGARGTSSLAAGGIGGGRSEVTRGATRLVIAGGGGGGGGAGNDGTAGGNGGNSGTNGGNGHSVNVAGGGTAGSGGTGGAGGTNTSNSVNGSAGTAAAGGAGGGTGAEGGGGGGGGGYGGGGGGASGDGQAHGNAAASGGGGAGGANAILSGTATTNSNGVQSGNGSVVFTYVGATAPNAPTLTAPANGAYQDVTGGVTFTGTYNSTDSANANGRALRYKTTGAYSYWNTSTTSWQGTVVYNAVSIAPSASGSFGPITAGLSNGTTYNWSMSDQESLSSLQGPFATDFTLNLQAAPTLVVNGPTGTYTASTQPTITWTTTPAAGLAQTFYRVVVEHGAYGTTPGSGTQDWDSGTVAGNAQTVAYGNGGTVTNANLTNQVTYRAFVKVTETNGVTSAWAFSTFTVSLDAPAQPAITAVAGTDPTTGCPRVAVTVQGRDNLLTANQASLETDTTGWTAGANTTIARTTAQALNGAASLSLTSSAAGSVSATTPTGSSGFAVTASAQVTVLASFRSAVSARSANVQILWYQANGSASAVRASDTSSNVTTSTSAWTQASTTVTAPSDAAFAAVVVTVLATGGASEVHYVDQIGCAPGASTTWTRGGLVGSTTTVITRSDGIVLRPSTGTSIPSPGQSVTVYDYEPTPSTAYTYTAPVSAVLGGNTITSAASTVSNSVTVTTTDWWFLDPTAVTGATNPAVSSFTLPRHEQAAATPVIGQTTMTVVSNVVLNADGQLTVETFTAAKWAAFQALTVSQKTLFVSSPYGESFYVRVGPSSGGSSGHNVSSMNLQVSSSANPRRTVTVSFVSQPRP